MARSLRMKMRTKAAKPNIRARTIPPLQTSPIWSVRRAISTLRHPSARQPMCCCDGGCPRCRQVGNLKSALEPADSAAERDADRKAAQVLSMTNDTIARESARTKTGSTGRAVPRASSHVVSDATATADSVGVSSSGGRPLNRRERSFFEPRFRRSFRDIRIHTDTTARQAVASLGALAFAFGRDVVIGEGAPSLESIAGKAVLAHELAHVDQQAKGESPTRVQRLVHPYYFYCQAGRNGAPPNPRWHVAAHDQRAAQMCDHAARLTNAEMVWLSTGAQTWVTQVFINRFGTPPNYYGYFYDRFYGTRHSTQNQAIRAEMKELLRRLTQVRDVYARNHVVYTCINRGLAETRFGQAAVWLGPAYWHGAPPGPPTNLIDRNAILLVHEGTHMVHPLIGDAAFPAPNAPFFVADCYARYVSDLNGATAMLAGLPQQCP